MLFRICALALAILTLNGCVATAIVGGGAAAASAAGDERPVGQHIDDVDLATRIEARLIAEKDMPSRWINVEVIDGVATLTGYLPTQNQIDRAVAICRSFAGVTSVDSQIMIGEPKTSSLFSDSWITAQVKAALIEDPIVSGLSIHVETVDGRVYLQGIVQQPKQRQRAVMLTRAIDGVTDVVDLLRSE
ncbi:MAG TPA: BON domain-containing protein [Mariprofundaceae bacterium]|nr:BON domain-containing protein [Mariprofundaceae bacterium]